MLPIMNNSYRNAFNWMPGFMNEVLNGFPTLQQEARTTSPAINVTEGKNDYKLELAVPGTTKEDYKIQLNNEGQLMVTLEKHEEKEDKAEDGRRYLRREFSYHKFRQVFNLPEDVESEKIAAQVTDGVLTIDLPKKAQEALPATRAIEVK